MYLKGIEVLKSDQLRY